MIGVQAAAVAVVSVGNVARRLSNYSCRPCGVVQALWASRHGNLLTSVANLRLVHGVPLSTARGGVPGPDRRLPLGAHSRQCSLFFLRYRSNRSGCGLLGPGRLRSKWFRRHVPEPAHIHRSERRPLPIAAHLRDVVQFPAGRACCAVLSVRPFRRSCSCAPSVARSWSFAVGVREIVGTASPVPAKRELMTLGWRALLRKRSRPASGATTCAKTSGTGPTQKI